MSRLSKVCAQIPRITEHPVIGALVVLAIVSFIGYILGFFGWLARYLQRPLRIPSWYLVVLGSGWLVTSVMLARWAISSRVRLSLYCKDSFPELENVLEIVDFLQESVGDRERRRFGEITWRWSHHHEGYPGEPEPFCSRDGTRLRCQTVDFGSRYAVQRHAYHAFFVCDLCLTITYGPYKGTEEDIIRAVRRQVDRKMHSEEWKSIVLAGKHGLSGILLRLFHGRSKGQIRP